ncbi:MAG: hypothetical protein JO166_04070 [Deltaproteobacteria bacterium]|nr:hypothetical protein [Deltaproteobacteria bacterium]
MEAVLLVNSCTSSGWFIALVERFPVMFSRGRVDFWGPDGPLKGNGRQGQAIFYLCKNEAGFDKAFAHLAYLSSLLAYKRASSSLSSLSVKKLKEATRLKTLAVRIPEKLIDRLKFRALKEHTTVQELAARAFESYLKQPREEGEQ